MLIKQYTEQLELLLNSHIQSQISPEDGQNFESAFLLLGIGFESKVVEERAR